MVIPLGGGRQNKGVIGLRCSLMVSLFGIGRGNCSSVAILWPLLGLYGINPRFSGFSFEVSSTKINK